MKPEEQQIAIANALGYTMEVKKIDYDGEKIKFGYWRDKNGESIGKDNPPDYLNDLNAMREAEATIRHDGYRWGIYVTRELPRVSQDITHATAAQRAEAFLKALSLWKKS